MLAIIYMDWNFLLLLDNKCRIFVISKREKENEKERASLFCKQRECALKLFFLSFFFLKAFNDLEVGAKWTNYNTKDIQHKITVFNPMYNIWDGRKCIVASALGLRRSTLFKGRFYVLYLCQKVSISAFLKLSSTFDFWAAISKKECLRYELTGMCLVKNITITLRGNIQSSQCSCKIMLYSSVSHLVISRYWDDCLALLSS